MKLFNEFGIDIGYVVLGMAGVILLMFIMLIVTMAKNSSTRKKYKKFMAGENGKNLEKAILDKFSTVDVLEADVHELSERVEDVSGKLVSSYQKIGLVKYDAFKEIGGKLSFALALLDKNNTGLILNAVHSRDNCFLYLKEIVKGESYVVLSQEEVEALRKAVNFGLGEIEKE